MLSSIWGFLCSAATIVKTIVVGKNTDAEVAAKTGSNVQADKAKIETDIAKGDVNAVGKDIS
jgi:hypothetical protein